MYRRLILIFLSGGMSTPEIRGIAAPDFGFWIADVGLAWRSRLVGTDQSKIANPKSKMSLPLPLLVLGVRADDPHDPLAADDLAVLANAPDAASHFHGCSFAAGPKTGES